MGTCALFSCQGNMKECPGSSLTPQEFNNLSVQNVSFSIHTCCCEQIYQSDPENKTKKQTEKQLKLLVIKHTTSRWHWGGAQTITLTGVCSSPGLLSMGPSHFQDGFSTET